MTPRETVENIILNGTIEQKKALYEFDDSDSNEIVLKRFRYFARGNYPRYFKSKDAPFHLEMVMNMIKSYRGENYINLGFRGCAKTSLTKLFICYVLLNDTTQYRKYIKVMSRDMKNPKQIVTDIYNMCLEVKSIYGDVFEKEGDKKREETMGSFTMRSGVKITAGTVGQTQRGHIQDAYRPDWIIFDDIEDRESISSRVITEGIISKCDEAITGLSKGGSWYVLGNYISENGSIQWFIEKQNRMLQITPIEVNGVSSWEIFTHRDIEQLKHDAEDFWGEYMQDPAKSEGKFFDIDRINRDLENCRDADRIVSDIHYWGHFLPHHRYGIGSDHSEGIGKDANACCLFDFNTGELIARYANNTISPDLSAHIFSRLGQEFGNCLYAPEVNNNCGGIVITTLKDIHYPNIFRTINETTSTDTRTEKLGWNTNLRTKPQMFFDFKRDYNDGLIKIYDTELLKEMKSYTNNDIVERSTGLITRHFDLLTSACIAWQMKDHSAITQREYRPTGNFTPMR